MLGDNKIINYIGNNTYTIMMNHVFSYFILNLCAIIIYKFNIGIFNDMDIETFKENVWFVVGNHGNVGVNTLYNIFAIAFPLIIKLIYQKYIEKKKTSV